MVETQGREGIISPSVQAWGKQIQNSLLPGNLETSIVGRLRKVNTTLRPLLTDLPQIGQQWAG
jgi:hypothetical protein